ncbi:hypothetical protein A3Q56_03291 [Intoshia linei]|uniref:Uncharacterized protein n=1 Tax=Intoshia linei TaxID=1819745 RepID=A0A177B430_9BILA|nr:hypothetical protein A3Q56_03291 [Intoshia linei]
MLVLFGVLVVEINDKFIQIGQHKYVDVKNDSFARMALVIYIKLYRKYSLKIRPNNLEIWKKENTQLISEISLLFHQWRRRTSI